MAHKVRIYDCGRACDKDGFRRPTAILQVQDPVMAEALATSMMEEQNSILAADIQVDWRLCETLKDCIHLKNACARWIEKNPIEGSFIGRLVEDLDHWAKYGVSTPEQMEKYLLLSSYSDLHKDVYGTRPRDTGLSMATPIEEIEAAVDRLCTPPATAEVDRPGF